MPERASSCVQVKQALPLLAIALLGENVAAHADFVLSFSKDGRVRVAVVRQAHHWVGETLARLGYSARRG